MRAVVERFAGTVDFEPVPVVRMHIVFVRAARRGPLPQVPIELRRHRHFFADADRLAHIAVPGFCVVRTANKAGVNFIDDLDGVRRRALLRAHLHELAVFLLRLHQHGALGRIVAARLFYIDVLARLQARRWPLACANGREWQW